ALPLGNTPRLTPLSPSFAQCSSSASASSTLVHGITPRPMRRSGATGQYSSPSQSLYARTVARYTSGSASVLQSRGPTCMLGKSASAWSASMSCSRSRCSGGPTPAVSSTVTPMGSQVSLVRPALRSRNGAGYGGWPSTRIAAPPSGSLVVRGAFSRNRAGMRGGPRPGRPSTGASLQSSGGRREGEAGSWSWRLSFIGARWYHRSAYSCRAVSQRGKAHTRRRVTMGAILGLGVTHSPPLAGQDENMARILKRVLQDPDLPERYRRPDGWPEPMRREYGDDQGLAAAGRHREAPIAGFRDARRRLDRFRPDGRLVRGGDQ